METENLWGGRTPAPLGRRVAAGCVDSVILSLLCATYLLIPLFRQGMGLPGWGVIAAVFGYVLIPLWAFRATLGMRLFSIELVGRHGHAASPTDVLFRELIGRGVLPATFLFTLLIGAVGTMMQTTELRLPSGLMLVAAVASMGLLAVTGPGHLLALGRDDRRTLADLVSRTLVAERRPRLAPEDEDERIDARSERNRRIAWVVLFEILTAASAFALPALLTTRTEGVDSYADRLTRARMEKEFNADPSNERKATELADAYRRAGDEEKALAVEKQSLDLRLQAVGCDKGKALKLGDTLNRARRFDDAVALVNSFESRCGEWSRLLWVGVYANEQKGSWQAAAELDTRLIQHEPNDSDFYWWRARAEAELGQYIQAAADYQASIARRPNGFAASRYARWAHEKLGRGCEPAFALQYWMEQLPREKERWVDDEVSRLYLNGNCDRLLGTGFAKVRAPRGTPLPKVNARIAGKPVVLLAQPLAGYTLLSSATAATLGLSLENAQDIRVFVSGQEQPARLIEVEEMGIDGARARSVQLAVADALPEGVSGILGVNFIWRFAKAETADGFTLRNRNEATRPSR